jgi:hypothetical protein
VRYGTSFQLYICGMTALPEAGGFDRVGDMERIVISKKEYAELVNTKRRVAAIDRKKKIRFIEAAFGAFRNDYGKESSVGYVTKLRKS